MLPPEDPDLILFGIVVAYILCRLFARFNWVPKLARGIYVVFEVLFPLLALSTFKIRSLFLVNILLMSIAVLLMEYVRRELKGYGTHRAVNPMLKCVKTWKGGDDTVLIQPACGRT